MNVINCFRQTQSLWCAAVMFCFSDALLADDCKGTYHDYAIITVQTNGDTSTLYTDDGTTTVDYTCVAQGAPIDFAAVKGKPFHTELVKGQSPFPSGDEVHTSKHKHGKISNNATLTSYEFTGCYGSDSATPPCKDPRIIVGAAGIFDFNPPSLSFKRAGPLTQKITIKNQGSMTVDSPLIKISEPTIVTSNPGSFKIVNKTCDSPLQRNATCEVSVAYSPGASPVRSNLEVTYRLGDGSVTQKVPLEGN